MVTTPNRKYELIGTNVTPDVKYWFNRLASQLDTDIQTVQTGWSKDPAFTTLAAQALAAAGKPQQLKNANVDALADGFFFWWTRQEMETMTGTMPLSPEGLLMPGLLWQYTTTNGLKFQIYFGYGSRGDVQYRATDSVSTGAMTPWRKLYTPPPAPPVIDPALLDSARRPLLVDAFKRRRGTVIGTAGKPAVALRFDHGWNNFQSKVLPLLEKYDLPWLQATNSRQNTTAGNVSQNTEVTLADVQNMALSHGGEIANHGATHNNAGTEAALLDEIVTGLSELKTAMPRLAIEHWCPPGTGAGGYMGYSNMSTLEHHMTLAGRLVQAHHAAVGGYVPGIYRSLPANLEIGLAHYTIDAASPANVADRLGNLSKMGTPHGLLLMLHPSLLDTAGNMTTAQLDTVLADLARRRDAGELEILTPGGLLLADHRTEHRHNLLQNSEFKGGTGRWTLGASWQLIPGGGIRVGGSSGILSQTVPYMGDYPELLGGVRELVVEGVTAAAAGGALTVTVRAGTLNVTKTFRDINPEDGPRTLRNQLVLPLDATAVSVELTRADGSPGMDIRAVRLQSI